MMKSCAKTISLILLLCFLILLSSSLDALADSNWSQYKNGPRRTGSSDQAASDNRGGLAWQWVINQTPWEDWHGFPTPCVIGPDNTIYFGDGENSCSGHGELIALYPNGSLKWLTSFRGEVLSTPAIGQDGSILVTDGRINAIDADGVILWNYTGSDGTILGSPLVLDDGTICVVEEGGGILCLTKEGLRAWEIADKGVYGIPAMASTGTILYTAKDEDGQFWAKTLSANGSLIWACGPFQSMITAPCVADDGTAYFGGEDGHVYAVSPQGAVVWSFATVGPVRGSPSLEPDGVVLACTGYVNGVDNEHWEEFGHQRLYAISGNGT
ncbi:MAG: PQQ-like beta-propeller repeat protein, partial [Deltaproteobacteria bacterium]|nr:PQQ-like beta-propeller repeat protein [Deltaproteobacteria bacterium]